MNRKWLLLFSFFCILSCEQEFEITDINENQPPEWLIPIDEVFDGGPGKDGIPSIDRPNFTIASEVNYLNDDEHVLVIKREDEIKVYPHSILNWHEIVNDQIQGLKFALTYCPLTGTGIGWNRMINGSETTFGVSGLLYNTNLMPYDRLTNSTWTQQGLRCVNGELTGLLSDNISFIETKFSTIASSYPDANVLNRNTGFGRDYNGYPYGDYLTNRSILFPIAIEDDRLHPKERTLALFIDNQPIAFTFNSEEEGLIIHQEIIANKDILIVVSKRDDIIVAFEYNKSLEFDPLQNDFPALFQDNTGNKYDIFGVVIQGPEKGNRLTVPTQFVGFWFSWASFYEELDLVEL